MYIIWFTVLSKLFSIVCLTSRIVRHYMGFSSTLLSALDATFINDGLMHYITFQKLWPSIKTRSLKALYTGLAYQSPPCNNGWNLNLALDRTEQLPVSVSH